VAQTAKTRGINRQNAWHKPQANRGKMSLYTSYTQYKKREAEILDGFGSLKDRKIAKRKTSRREVNTYDKKPAIFAEFSSLCVINSDGQPSDLLSFYAQNGTEIARKCAIMQRFATLPGEPT